MNPFLTLLPLLYRANAWRLVTAAGSQVRSRPAPTARAQIVASQARRAVVTRGDVPIADVGAVHERRVDHLARVGRPGGPHRRARAGAADREPAKLALKAHGVIDRHARSRIGVQRHVRRGPLAAAVDLAVLCKARLSGGS